MTAKKTMKKKQQRKRKKKQPVHKGRAYVQATFNNTVITITDEKGNVLAQSSAGAEGFKGSRKGTAYAAQIASEAVATKVEEMHNMKSVDVYVKGIGLGRDSAIRGFGDTDIIVESITDTTPVPHNGTRPKKQRRA